MKCILSGLTKFTAASILATTLIACGGAEDRKISYLEKSKVYLADKNYKKAKIELKNVLQIDPKFAEAYFLMGKLNEGKKDLGKSLANYKKAIELNPSYTLAKVKLAKIYVIAGTKDFIEKAKVLLEEVKHESPNNSEADLIAATIRYKVGDKQQAISDLEAVVSKDPKLTKGIGLLSTIYIASGDDDKALNLLVKGVTDNTKNIPLRIRLAKLLAKNKKLIEAEKYLKQAIILDPERYSLQVALSSFYATSNQLKKAEKTLRNAIKLDDEDARRYLVLIQLLSSRVSLKIGEEELLKFIKLKPELYELQFALANFYEKTNSRDKAKQVIKRIISDKSFDVEGLRARNYLARLLLEEGNELAAQKYVDEVIAEYPNNNEALLLVSKLALKNLDAITAINGLRTVVKNEPKNAEASLLLAQAHELNKEGVLAENELKRAIEANPINVQTHINLALYLGNKGRIEKALKVVDKALAYFKDNFELMEIKLKIVASQGKESEVVALLNLMDHSNESKAEVNTIKGQYYLGKGDVNQALEQFELAYQKSQDKFKPLQMIVKTYVSNRQADKAIQRLQKNLDINPNEAISNLLLGQVFITQKNLLKAREKFVLASSSAKSWYLPYSSLAATYVAEKNLDKALSIYKGALGKLKNKVPAQIQIASILEKKKDFLAAIDVYKNILSTYPANMLAANNYASLLLDHGKQSDIPKALELTKKFENLQQVALLDTLGWAYAKTGETDKAINILKPIVEKSPEIAIFRYHLGYALYKSGDKAAAKSHLQIASSSKQEFPGKVKAAELLNSI